jgi:acetyl-CoA acetyltransferase
MMADPTAARSSTSVTSDAHAPVRVVLVDDHEMLRRGLAGMCVGVGQGVVTIFERL